MGGEGALQGGSAVEESVHCMRVLVWCREVGLEERSNVEKCFFGRKRRVVKFFWICGTSPAAACDPSKVF